MTITVFDSETTFQVKRGLSGSGKKQIDTDPSPYHPLNRLVCVQYAGLESDVVCDFLYHTDTARLTKSQEDVRRDLQDTLDATTLLVMHHGKFDLSWLRECGFVYNGDVWDTAIVEYVLMSGMKRSTRLKDCAKRRGCEHQKLDIVQDYFDDGISCEHIPIDILEEYAIYDILSTRDLYLKQLEILKEPANVGLMPTIHMSNEFTMVLSEMEGNGIPIDMGALTAVKQEFQAELDEKNSIIDKTIPKIMGDTPINMASPQDKSILVYSRSVKDKPAWAETFNIGKEDRGGVMKEKYRPKMTKGQFANAVMRGTSVVYKTKARQCSICKGGKKIPQLLRGKITKRMVRCPHCRNSSGEPQGIIYVPTKDVAGLKLIADGVFDVSNAGFKTDGDTIDRLKYKARVGLSKDFLGAMCRVNSLTSYINNYCGGITRFVGDDLLLHTHLNQCITATGRLSSSSPNFQNMPRAGTFPVRRAVVSRWANIGGRVAEADYAQLEFRCAVFMAQDAVGMQEILDGFDVHNYTAAIIAVIEANPSFKVQQAIEVWAEQTVSKDERQDAKADTFKPLYGGVSGSEAQKAYYKAFALKYTGISTWQDGLQDEAIRYKSIRLPTGRRYAFPFTERTKWGGATFATQIKNYPVQGFATADIVPIACINVRNLFIANGLKSLPFLTVHDSIVVDIYPGEEKTVSMLLTQGMLGVIDSLYERYGVQFNVPLEVEVKAGPNWMDTEVIAVEKRHEQW